MSLDFKQVKVGVLIDSQVDKFWGGVSQEDQRNYVNRTLNDVKALFYPIGYYIKFELINWYRGSDPFESVPRQFGSTHVDGKAFWSVFFNHVKDRYKESGYNNILLLTGRYWGQAGLAYPVSACLPSQPGPLMCFGVNRSVIAHELGHVLGAGHDVDERTEDGKTYLMSRSSGPNQAFQFSPRSLEHFRIVRERGDFECLKGYEDPRDVDKDGKVGLSDVTAMLQAMYLRGAPLPKTWDFNKDGRISISDAIFLLNEIF